MTRASKRALKAAIQAGLRPVAMPSLPPMFERWDRFLPLAEEAPVMASDDYPPFILLLGTGREEGYRDGEEVVMRAHHSIVAHHGVDPRWECDITTEPWRRPQGGSYIGESATAIVRDALHGSRGERRVLIKGGWLVCYSDVFFTAKAIEAMVASARTIARALADADRRWS